MLEYSGLIIITAIAVDYALPEPKHYHPLAGFGTLAAGLEERFNQAKNTLSNRFLGLFALLLLVTPLPLAVLFIDNHLIDSGWPHFMFSTLLLYGVIAPHSLEQHARAVQQAMRDHNLSKARQKCSFIVSRDTVSLDQTALSRATIESVLENGNDALFGPLFWFLITGASGALVYRLVNTLDAMWGYKNQRFQAFGWAAARLDDLMNWVPARCCSLCYSLAGRCRQGLVCWRRQAPAMSSPNAGPVMASGAGALNLTLGGAAIYQGITQYRPTLGYGPAPNPEDIQRAICLLRRAIFLFSIFVLTVETIMAVLQ